MLMQSAKMYFAAQTATQKNLKNLYLNASWAHGAGHVFYKKNFAETYIHYHEFKLNIHLVANEETVKFTNMSNFQVIPVGVPFVYTYPTKKNRFSSSFKRVYFPTHGIEGYDLNSSYLNWLNLAIKYKCDAICIAGRDFILFKETTKNVLPGNISLLCGAIIDEPYTLVKMRNIFYSIEECLVDFAGSHIVYALICGCKIRVIDEDTNENFMLQNTQALVKNLPSRLHPFFIENFNSRLKLIELRNFFKGVSHKGLVELAESTCGLRYRKKIDELEKLLIPKNTKENIFNFSKISFAKMQHKLLNNVL